MKPDPPVLTRHARLRGPPADDVRLEVGARNEFAAEHLGE